MSLSRHQLLALVLAFAFSGLAAGCSDQDEGPSWTFSFDPADLETRAALVRATIVPGGCSGTDPIYATEIAPGDRAPFPSELAAGVYGLAGEARESSCNRIALGCLEVTVPLATDVVVMLEEVAAVPACNAAQTCSAGSCTRDEFPDTGMPPTDATTDSAMGDTSTPPTDAGIGETLPQPTLAAGWAHACVVRGSDVLCWGENGAGQLGDGTTTDRTAPVRVSGLPSSPVGITAARTHTCALLDSGQVACWGEGDSGRLGNGAEETRSSPQLVIGIDDAEYLDCGESHCCVVRAGARLSCWGRGNDGELGHGMEANSSTPIDVPGIADAIQVVGGDDFSCALHSDRTVSCWADDEYGTIGDGVVGDNLDPTPVLGLDDAVQLSAGEASKHACALLSDGGVVCWGLADHGQLGDGVAGWHIERRFVRVQGLDSAMAVDVGGRFTCALDGAGAASCWGRNTFGQLGDGTRTEHSAPVAVSGSSGIAELALGREFTCALSGSGTVSCWGADDYGQLGDAGSWDEPTPVMVAGIDDAVQLGVGNDTACARRASGRIYCWGNNTENEVGNGGDDIVLEPAAVAGIGDAVDFAVGPDHGCAVRATGEARCWGHDGSGRLGNGSSRSSQSVPDLVVGVTDAQDIGAGYEHSCVLQSTGTVSCWGDNGTGQLGNGTTTDSSTAVPVAGITGATTLSVGAYHTCAQLGMGEVRCWGGNGGGRLGDGTTMRRTTPVSAMGLTGVTQLSAGRSHTCALTPTATLCWGDNDRGQVGDGTMTDTTIPTALTALAMDGSYVAAGNSHSCAITTTQTTCWGSNDNGELGDGSRASRLAAGTPVSGLGALAVEVAAGDDISCARLAAGSVACWGENLRGELGDGTLPAALAPVDLTLP